jgi:hypothetical protein
MKESNVGPQPTASTESVRSVSQSSAGSRQVLWACVSGWDTYKLREDRKHARARREAQSSREIPTHVDPRVIEQKQRPTPTRDQHNTTHARIHPKPNTCVHAQPHSAPTEQQQSKKNPHTNTDSELAERACKEAPQ